MAISPLFLRKHFAQFPLEGEAFSCIHLLGLGEGRFSLGVAGKELGQSAVSSSDPLSPRGGRSLSINLDSAGIEVLVSFHEGTVHRRCNHPSMIKRC